MKLHDRLASILWQYFCRSYKNCGLSVRAVSVSKEQLSRWIDISSFITIICNCITSPPHSLIFCPKMGKFNIVWRKSWISVGALPLISLRTDYHYCCRAIVHRLLIPASNLEIYGNLTRVYSFISYRTRAFSNFQLCRLILLSGYSIYCAMSFQVNRALSQISCPFDTDVLEVGNIDTKPKVYSMKTAL